MQPSDAARDRGAQVQRTTAHTVSLPSPTPNSHPRRDMRRDARLRRAEDFAAVYREGRATSSDLMVVRARRNAVGRNRYGFSVGKRVGKAVERNRVKRRLRAAVDGLMQSSAAPAAPGDLAGDAGGWDIVVIARAPAARVTYDDLVRTVTALFRRARLLPDGLPRDHAPRRPSS